MPDAGGFSSGHSPVEETQSNLYLFGADRTVGFPPRHTAASRRYLCLPNISRNSFSDRAMPSSIKTTDFALLTGLLM